jgi:hypothetical protein
VILIPIAMTCGLKATMACMAINLAGHGMALSGDLVLQGAPSITANAASVEIGSVLKYGAIFATVTGVIALVSAFVINRKEFAIDKAATDKANAIKGPEDIEDHIPSYAKFFAIMVPVVFIAIVIRILLGAAVEEIEPVFGGDATALLGGAAAMILVISTAVDAKKDFLERVVVYLRDGMLFAMIDCKMKCATLIG